METTPEQFVEKVFTFLPTITDQRDIDSIRKYVLSLYTKGFSILDTVDLTCLTEEVNPDLEEDRACLRMEKIYARCERTPRSTVVEA